MRKLSVTLAYILAALIFLSFAAWCVLSKDASIPAAVSALVFSTLFLIMLLNILPRIISFFSSPDAVAPYELLGERSRRFLHPWFKLILGAIAYRAALVVLAYAIYNAKFGFSSTIFAAFDDIWILRDPASHLAFEAVNGGYLNTGDFSLPLLPVLLVRGIDLIIKCGPLSAFIINTAACCVLVVAVYELALMDLPKKQALFAAALLMVLPSSLSLLKPMDPAALFMALGALCLIALRKNRFIAAGAFALLLPSVSGWGGMLIIIIIFELVRRAFVLSRSGDSLRLKRCIAGATAGVMLALIGISLPVLFAFLKGGDALLPLRGEYPAFADGIRPFFAGGAMLLKGSAGAFDSADTAQLLNVWLPAMVWALTLPILFTLSAKRLRGSYSALFVIWYALTLSFGRLDSFTDAAFLLPLIVIAAACVCESRRSRAAVFSVMLVFMLLRLVAYIII